MHSTTQSLPRSSMAKAMGWTTSGSPTKRLAWKPSGRVMAFGASFGGMGLSPGAAKADRDRQRRAARESGERFTVSPRGDEAGGRDSCTSLGAGKLGYKGREAEAV